MRRTSSDLKSEHITRLYLDFPGHITVSKRVVSPYMLTCVYMRTHSWTDFACELWEKEKELPFLVIKFQLLHRMRKAPQRKSETLTETREIKKGFMGFG